MRTIALAGLFALTIVAASSSAASAQTLELLQTNNIDTNEPRSMDLATVNASQTVLAAIQPPAPKSTIVKYKVAKNDTLTTIAKAHNTEWKRLFDKNESVQHPDVIKEGDELVIPNQDEVLKERPVPEPPKEPVTPPQPAPSTPAATQRPARTAPKVAARVAPKAAARVTARGSSSGNTYTAGYCTWYVKNKRPDLPNNLGNADTWVIRARAQGMPTGSTPRAGAVGQRGMHVVYVESVNADGSVNISEMNHKGLYVVTRRTLPASYFTYIY